MDEFYGHLYLANADRLRYASILRGMDAHYLQRKDDEAHKCPQDLISAQHILRGHKCDPEYKEKKKKKKEDSEDGKPKSKDKDDTQFTFAQMRNSCYCCGKNHKLPDCPDKMTTPKDKWHINKARETKQYQNMITVIEATMNQEIRNA